jgi:cytochrome c-type biogenesis protein CcmH/NrfF
MHAKLRRRSRLLAPLLLGAAVVQAAVPLTNERVRKLGQQLKCKCGCNASITDCNMINCHFSDPVRLKLLAMIDQGGKSDGEIIEAIASEYGRDILLNPPSEGFYALGWTMPYIGLAAGAGALGLVLKSYLKKRPAADAPAAPASPELDRYRERIDKELSGME